MKQFAESFCLPVVQPVGDCHIEIKEAVFILTETFVFPIRIQKGINVQLCQMFLKIFILFIEGVAP